MSDRFGRLEEVPTRVIAQVLSLSEGAVRLSWVFDWAVLPKELMSCEWAVRGFEIVRRREPTNDMGMKSCTHDDVASSASCMPTVWASLASPPVSADLRDSSCCAESSSNDVSPNFGVALCIGDLLRALNAVETQWRSPSLS